MVLRTFEEIDVWCTKYSCLILIHDFKSFHYKKLKPIKPSYQAIFVNFSL